MSQSSKTDNGFLGSDVGYNRMTEMAREEKYRENIMGFAQPLTEVGTRDININVSGEQSAAGSST
jgi:hypothetical protein